MRKAMVKVNGKPAGRLEKTAEGYRFTYLDSYLELTENPSVSLTLPKASEAFESSTLFPFFHGLLAEGALKKEQCIKLRLDENDHFGRLLKTTHQDTIGAVTVHQEEE
ncbi:MAG: HipA-like protein [Kiritimatiellia bacterium]|jgi:HipA-like protein